MGIVMYVFDDRYPIKDIKPGLHGQKTVRRVVVGPRVAIQETVRMVLDAKAKDEKIELLRLCGHGNSGGLILGSGLVTTNVDALLPLQEQMDNGAAIRSKRVQIHGCGVASDTGVIRPGADATHPTVDDIVPGTWSGKRDRAGFGGQGFQFLLSLAWAVRSKVEGAINAQVANPGFLYGGKTVVVDPDGTVQVIDNSQMKTSGPAMVADPD